MNKDDLIKKLEHLDLPNVEISSHQRRLKMALLNSGYWKEKNTMPLLKKFAPIGVIAAIAIVAIISVVSLTGQPSQASAQEIAKKSYQTVANLSVDQQAKISSSLGMDSRTILQEAYNAKDLKSMSYADFASSEGQLPLDPDGKLKTLKFLQFTKDDGQVITLGIDSASNLPVFGSARYANPNPSEEVSGEKSFNTQFRGDKGDGQGLVNCTMENGVEKCKKVNE